jgi:TIR domain
MDLCARKAHPDSGWRSPLSYVGDPFDYDVFVSYAHAEAETQASKIRAWSRYSAESLRDLLATALNAEGGPSGSKVQVFLDDRVLVSGQPLTETLREKAQRSALLLVFMSPFYPSKSWCLDELEWFFQQAARDGRGRDHCTVLRIQPLGEDLWPKQLRDERGRPVYFHDFVDPRTELPIGVANLGAPELAEALLEPFIEIRGKLMSLRRQLEARRQMTVAGTQRPADRPVIYFDADPDEEPLWQDLKGALRDLAIVRPVKLAQANGDVDPLDRERQKQRQLQFASSDGLVLLHGRRGTWIENAVELSYRQRRLLWQSRHNNLPWAILDRVGDALSVADTYDVPCVPTASNEWPRQLLVALGLVSGDQGVGVAP